MYSTRPLNYGFRPMEQLSTTRHLQFMTTQTKYQVPRGTRADAERFNRLYLIKNVKLLRATYQIRLLAFRAVTEGLKLVLKVPSACEFDRSLCELIEKTGNTILREDY